MAWMPDLSPAAVDPDRIAARAALDRLWATGRDFLGCEAAIMGGAMSWVSEPRTDGGSCGRGWTGGGSTNWKSSVRSPMTTLPRDLSDSRTWNHSPFLTALPRSWARVTGATFVSNAMRPSMPSLKLSA